MNDMDSSPAPTTGINWKALLGEIGLAKMRLEEAAPRLFPLTLPHVGANSDQLAEAEQRLGHPLDPAHRELLTYANGWPDLFVRADLLSTDELGAAGVWARTSALLADLEEDWAPGYMPPAAELEPIAVTENYSDWFILWTGGPVTDGGHPVIWLGSGARVEQWPNVVEFMRSVLAYTQHKLADVIARRPPYDEV